MPATRKRIYDLIDLEPGNLAVSEFKLENWGATLVVKCIYRYPPAEKRFRLIFQDCRGIQWNVQKTGKESATLSETQMLTHDLGQDNYERTARFATTLVELIVSYRTMSFEVDL